MKILIWPMDHNHETFYFMVDTRYQILLFRMESQQPKIYAKKENETISMAEENKYKSCSQFKCCSRLLVSKGVTNRI